MADYDAFVLVSFGGPEGPADVIPFLENVTRGRGVPRERLAEVAHHYDRFGGVSPINQQCRDLLAAIEKAHTDYRAVVESFSDAQLMENVKFFSAPKTMGDYQRIGFMWFLLSDQIHHRGQFSIYSRMADGKVPSIYGPSADEPWN